MLPNGNWRNRDEIDIHIPPGQDFVEAYVKEQRASAMAVALVGSAFRLYNKKNFHGQEEAISDPSLAQVCYGLLSDTYPLFLQDG